MSRSRLLAGVILIVAGILCFFWPWGGNSDAGRNAAPGAERSPSPVKSQGTSKEGTGGQANVGSVGVRASLAAAQDPADFPIAAELNAHGSTIGRDLDIVSQLFDAWRSNFPHDGNPVGENAEITAALMGDNRLGFALIPKGHRAVNENGELCDRWGTPFRLHQLSGSRMEIQSAGPDRKFATEDDAKWTPQ